MTRANDPIEVESGDTPIANATPGTKDDATKPSGYKQQDSILGQNKLKKTDTKNLDDYDDPDYVDTDEEEDTRKGGKKMFWVLPYITRQCHPGNKPQTQMIRCIGSKNGCQGTWSGAKRDKKRVLAHAASCGYVASTKNGEYRMACLTELALSDPTAAERLRQQLPGGGQNLKRARSGSQSEMGLGDSQDEPGDSATLKRAKVDGLTRPPGTSQQSRNSTSKLNRSSDIAVKGKDSFANFRTEGKVALESRANNALVRLLVCCGIPPRVIDREEFRDFVTSLNPGYVPPSRSHVEERLIVSYAANVRLLQIKYLQTQWDLQISFNGGKLRKLGFYSVHVTDSERNSFCLELDDGSRLSHTGEYVCELLLRVCVLDYSSWSRVLILSADYELD